MRTIKFRGKRTDTGEWMTDMYTIIQDADGTWLQDANECQQIDPDTLGQFTGLLDKNGKEIYEGDIVKYIGNEIGDVFTNEVTYDGAGFDPVCAIYWMSDIEGTGCKVIGNIHDNPELLKGGKE